MADQVVEPQMNADKRGLGADAAMDQLTESILGCAFRVSNTLESGFLEKVYENALAPELRKQHRVDQQVAIAVHYDGIIVGDYVADLLIENKVLIELKTVKAIDDLHIAQTINYLKATGLHIGFVMNFAKPKLEYKRLVHRY